MFLIRQYFLCKIGNCLLLLRESYFLYNLSHPPNNLTLKLCAHGLRYIAVQLKILSIKSFFMFMNLLE